MKHSSGAILYTFDPDGVCGIILGMEHWSWLPFKGGNKVGETLEDAAIREVYEETGGLVMLKNIALEHSFSSHHKHYHIGLSKAPYSIIEEFDKVKLVETRKEFSEKKMLKFFSLDAIKNNTCIHSLTMASINFYWDRLNAIAKNRRDLKTEKNGQLRKYSVCPNTAMKNYKEHLIQEPDKKEFKPFTTAKRSRSCKIFNTLNLSDSAQWRPLTI